MLIYKSAVLRDLGLQYCLQFAIGAFICLVVSVYRWMYLEESEVGQCIAMP